jgi:hypothetical protein
MTKEKKPTVLGLNKDLKEFKEEVRKGQDQILSVLSKLSEPDVEEKTVEDVEAEPLKGREPSAKEKVLFEKYFDSEDGFKLLADYPDRNRVTVLVPRKLSNAHEGYFSLYKQDLRSTGIIEGNDNDWERSIEAHFKRVVGQLHYDRSKKLK